MHLDEGDAMYSEMYRRETSVVVWVDPVWHPRLLTFFFWLKVFVCSRCGRSLRCCAINLAPIFFELACSLDN